MSLSSTSPPLAHHPSNFLAPFSSRMKICVPAGSTCRRPSTIVRCMLPVSAIVASAPLLCARRVHLRLDRLPLCVGRDLTFEMVAHQRDLEFERTLWDRYVQRDFVAFDLALADRRLLIDGGSRSPRDRGAHLLQ